MTTRIQLDRTHFILDGRNRVIVSLTGRLYDAEEAEVNVRREGAKVTELVTLADADVATIARIARADNPKLGNMGSGPFAAGANPAAPYLDAMSTLGGVTEQNIARERYGAESAENIVRRFLSNASQWRGDVARACKARLNQIVGA